MNNMTDNIHLDSWTQHFKYLLEGYFEHRMSDLYGEDNLEYAFGIDIDRYSPGSARRMSYEEGWKVYHLEKG